MQKHFRYRGLRLPFRIYEKKKNLLWKYDDEFMGLKLWGSFYSSKNRGRGGGKSPIWMAYITITRVLCLYFS